MRPNDQQQQTEIRESWSENERSRRRQLAGKMQLQLRQMVFLAAIVTIDQSGDEANAFSNAC